ncbi:putative multiple-sugar transport system permease YteP [compost metagenome]
MGIDQEIYEAAEIDGASRVRRIFSITLPLLKNTVILLLILNVGKIFNGDFGLIYAMVGNNTLLYPTTDIIDTYVYRALMELGDMGMSSAVGLAQSVVGFIFVLLTNAIAKRASSESALF